MGNIKKQTKKYGTPKILWDATRLEEEKELLKNYGLRRKKELWKMEAVLRRARKQAINLIPRGDKQADKEKKELIAKLVKLGLIKAGAKMEDILDLELKNILDRRLQTLVYNMGLSKSVNQARQFIVHGHILIDDNCVSIPSYLVKDEEESKIGFSNKSKLFDAEHPERVVKKVEVKGIKTKKVEEQPKVEAKKEVDVKEKIEKAPKVEKKI